jgi:hypothetical protein
MSRVMPPIRRAAVVFCAVLMACAGAGCATTFGTTVMYNHADWLIARQLDGYVGLTRPQKAFVAARLDRILDHHRREALPRYETVLSQVRARVQRGLLDDDLEWAFTQYEQLRADLLSRFVPDGAEFVRLVEASQIGRVRRALEARLAAQEASVRDSSDARLAKRTERILALATEWLGPLTRQQEQEVTRLAMAFPDTLPLFHARQRQRNERLIALLESNTDGDTGARLRAWLLEQEPEEDPTFLEAAAQLKRHIARLILALDHIATPAQRTHVLAKLDELAQTVHRLSGV